MTHTIPAIRAAAFAALSIFVASSGPGYAAQAKRHMIVTAEKEASEAGLAMLRQGGSAVDAAIAAQLVLTLIEPQSSGIGGGAYMLVSAKDGMHAYDGREMAPQSAKPGMFLGTDGNPRGFRDVARGGLAVGVPGTLAMMEMAHKAHGKLAWKKLFAPAIALSEKGFAVPQRLARDLKERPQYAEMPDMKAHYFIGGKAVEAGTMLRNHEFAATLRAAADRGSDGFYKGAVAQKIAAAVSTATINPTALTLSDLESYRPHRREALCGVYRAYRVCGVPPSTSGGTTVLEILGLLERFPSENLKPGTLSTVHLVSEASRLAYADRARWIGDPDFVTVPVSGLLDASYLKARSQLIDPLKSMGTAKAGEPPMKQGMLRFAPQPAQPSFGTSHLSVVDEAGTVVSMTMSVQTAFGAQIMAGGFILNNELTDFSFVPEIEGRPVANAPAPGKRPLSSMSPTIVFDPEGNFFASLGSPGGRQIIAYVAQALVSLIDGKLSMQEASAAPRHVTTNGPTLIETGTPLEALKPDLERIGHRVTVQPFDSGLNGIRRVAGAYEGGADPRRSGLALGD